jgi:AraC-like DNA-binding protein
MKWSARAKGDVAGIADAPCMARTNRKSGWHWRRHATRTASQIAHWMRRLSSLTPIHSRSIMTFLLSSSVALADDLAPVSDPADEDEAPDFVDAPSFDVRVWNEGEFRREGSMEATGVHLVLSSLRPPGVPPMDAQSLRASLASGEARLLLLARDHMLELSTPVVPSCRGGLPPGALRRVREFVSQRLAEKIELAHLADIAGLSVCHFSRAFKQSMGLPPHRYLMRERVAAAARLIRGTDRPLVEISLEVGFSDQSHFTRCFSDLMGATPRDYRRKHR